jgi:hypothetical protein
VVHILMQCSSCGNGTPLLNFTRFEHCPNVNMNTSCTRVLWTRSQQHRLVDVDNLCI